MQILAALILAVSGGLHIAAGVASGFAPDGVSLLGFGVLDLVLAFGLFRGWRWLAYIVFPLIMLGAIAALAASFDPGPVPAIYYTAIAIADAACALALFLALWPTYRSATA